jgi:hypothetical protein
MTSPLDRRIARGLRLGLSPGHSRKLARLTAAEAIQDFLATIPINFEPDGDSCWSVAEALRRNVAHCIEGAFVAACALWLNGQRPLLMDLRAYGDDDHVVTLYRRGRSWGAISKSNHIWLRWRDPVYRSPRELAMSYFHEYVSGPTKSLRDYSRPFDLSRFDPEMWVTRKEGCWEIAAALDDSPHHTLITRAQSGRLRDRDPIELEAGKILEYVAPNKKSSWRY